MPLRHVIVGSGIAGLCAAEVLRQNDAEAAITIISEEPHNFYSRPGLAYLLRGDIPERQLFIRSKHDLRAMHLQRIHAVAESLSENQEVVLRDGRRVAYDRLLLATGALAVPPTFPGSDLAGIVKLDGLDDTRRILKLARRGKPAVVIGGGVTALELAEGLRARGMHVHYLLRKARFWGDVLDEVESNIVMDRLRRRRHSLAPEHPGEAGDWRQGPCHRRRDAGRRDDTVPNSGRGYRRSCPRRSDAQGRVGRGQVSRGEGHRGRCAPADEPAQRVCSRRLRPGRRRAPRRALAHGQAQGCIAGMNMAGCRVPYVKGVACNVTLLAGLKVTIIGNVGSGAPGADTNGTGPLVGAGRDGKLDDDVVSMARGKRILAGQSRRRGPVPSRRRRTRAPRGRPADDRGSRRDGRSNLVSPSARDDCRPERHLADSRRPAC